MIYFIDIWEKNKYNYHFTTLRHLVDILTFLFLRLEHIKIENKYKHTSKE